MIKLYLQMFGGGSSGANTGPGGSKSTSKQSLSSSAPGSGRGSGGGRNMDTGSFQPKRTDEDDRPTRVVPYASGERYYTDGAKKIEKGEQYFLRQYRSNGSSSNYGILDANEAKELLRGYSYDDKYQMWFTKRGNRGFEVYKIKKKK